MMASLCSPTRMVLTPSPLWGGVGVGGASTLAGFCIDLIALAHGGQVVDVSVEFDHQAPVQVCEIENKCANRRLSPGMAALDAAQQFPHATLRRRRVAAQTLCARIGFRKISLPVRHLNRPPPLPLPTRGRGRTLRDLDGYRPSGMKRKFEASA